MSFVDGDYRDYINKGGSTTDLRKGMFYDRFANDDYKKESKKK